MGDFRLYKRNDDYIFETWGSSTKHPDAMFSFNDWREKEIISELRGFYDFDYSWLQWLCYIASTMLFDSTTRGILKYAGNMYTELEEKELKPSELIDK